MPEDVPISNLIVEIKVLAEKAIGQITAVQKALESAGSAAVTSLTNIRNFQNEINKITKTAEAPKKELETPVDKSVKNIKKVRKEIDNTTKAAEKLAAGQLVTMDEIIDPGTKDIVDTTEKLDKQQKKTVKTAGMIKDETKSAVEGIEEGAKAQEVTYRLMSDSNLALASTSKILRTVSRDVMGITPNVVDVQGSFEEISKNIDESKDLAAEWNGYNQALKNGTAYTARYLNRIVPRIEKTREEAGHISHSADMFYNSMRQTEIGSTRLNESLKRYSDIQLGLLPRTKTLKDLYQDISRTQAEAYLETKGISGTTEEIGQLSKAWYPYVTKIQEGLGTSTTVMDKFYRQTVELTKHGKKLPDELLMYQRYLQGSTEGVQALADARNRFLKKEEARMLGLDRITVATRNREAAAWKQSVEISKRQSMYLRWIGRDLMRVGFMVSIVGAAFASQFAFAAKSSFWLEGAIEDIRYALEDVYSVVGDALGPLFDTIAEFADTLADLFERFPALGTLVGGFALFGTIVAGIAGPLLTFSGLLITLKYGAEDVAKRMGWVSKETKTMGGRIKELLSLPYRILFKAPRSAAQSMMDAINEGFREMGWSAGQMQEFWSQTDVELKNLMSTTDLFQNQAITLMKQMGATPDQAVAMAEKMKKINEEVKGTSKVQVEATRKTSRFKGSMGKLGTMIVSAASALGGFMIMGALFTPLMEAMEPVLTAVTDAFESFIEPFMPAIEAIGEFVDQFPEIGIGLAGLVLTLPSLMRHLPSLVRWIGGGKGLAGAAAKASSLLSPLAIGLGVVLGVVIASIIKWDELTALWNSTVGPALEALNKAWTRLLEILGLAGRKMKGVTDEISPLTGALNFLSSAWDSIYESILQGFIAPTKMLIGWIEDAVNSLTWIIDAISAVADAFSSAGEAITGFFSGGWLSTGVSSITAGLGQIAHALGFSPGLGAQALAATKAVHGLKTELMNVPRDITTRFRGLEPIGRIGTSAPIPGVAGAGLTRNYAPTVQHIYVSLTVPFTVEREADWNKVKTVVSRGIAEELRNRGV